jgi:hypothetical protein
LPQIPHQILSVPDRLAIDSLDHIASKKPGFVRFAASGTLKRNYSSFDWSSSGGNLIQPDDIARPRTGPKNDLTTLPTPNFAECPDQWRHALKAAQAVWQWPAGARNSWMPVRARGRIRWHGHLLDHRFPIGRSPNHKLRLNDDGLVAQMSL